MRHLVICLLLFLLVGCERGPMVVDPGRFQAADLTVILQADGQAGFILQTTARRSERVCEGTWRQTGPDAATLEIRITQSSAPTSYRRGDLFRFRYDGDKLVFIDRRGRDGMVLEAAATRTGTPWVMARVGN